MTYINHDDFYLRFPCSLIEATRIGICSTLNEISRHCRIGKIRLKGK